MKSKSINEGFKFFTWCCATSGFTWNIIPGGRLERATTARTATTLVCKAHPPRRETERCALLAWTTASHVQRLSNKMRAASVAVAGAARFQRGRPRPAHRNIDGKRFNALHLTKDGGFLWCVDTSTTSVVAMEPVGHGVSRPWRCRVWWFR